MQRAFLRNESGVAEIPGVVRIDVHEGPLPAIGFSEPHYGARVTIVVSAYSGPDSLSGLLVFGDELRASVVWGARLIKCSPSNIGTTELVFQAESQDDVNSPMISAGWDYGEKCLTGPIPNRW
jgi:hypothetical protein